MNFRQSAVSLSLPQARCPGLPPAARPSGEEKSSRRLIRAITAASANITGALPTLSSPFWTPACCPPS